MKRKIFKSKRLVIGIGLGLVLLWCGVLLLNYGPQLWQLVLSMHP
jgi:hypothetical protein